MSQSRQPLQIGDIVTPFSTIEAKNKMNWTVTLYPGLRFEIVSINDGFACLTRTDSDSLEWSHTCQLCDLERW